MSSFFQQAMTALFPPTEQKEEPECMSHFKSALVKLQMGQKQEAYEGLIYSIEMDDEYKIEHRTSPLMKLLESMGRFDEMISITDKLLIKHPNALGFIIWKGVAMKHLDRLDEAEECFENAVNLQPTNEMFVTLYCSILLEKKKWNKFMEINKKMIEYKPMAVQYHNNYIEALQNLNEKEKAEKHVLNILEKYGPKSASINFIAGDYYYKQEDFEKAENCLKTAASLDIKNEQYQQYYMRSLLQNGKQNEADKYCHDLISRDPNNPRWINTVGYICFDSFDFQSAAKHFKQCIKLQPNDPYNIVDLAMVLCELNELDEAEKIIKEILNKNPNFISAQYRLARIMEYKNEYKKAQQIYLNIIKTDPFKAKINMGYAHLLYLMKDYKESMKYFEIAQKVDAANPWFHFWFGLLLNDDKYKRYQDGIKCFDKCLKLQAMHHKCHYQYALLLCYKLKKNKKKAIEHLKEAAKIDYNNKKYKQLLQKFINEYDEENDDDDDDEKEQKLNDDNDDNEKIMKLVKKEYVFKSIDNKNKSIVCMDNDFKDIILKLDELNLDEIKNINDKIEEGANNKKDVKIVVVETHTKNNKITQKVSHAKI